MDLINSKSPIAPFGSPWLGLFVLGMAVRGCSFFAGSYASPVIANKLRVSELNCIDGLHDSAQCAL
jgi:hypothetical protein